MTPQPELLNAERHLDLDLSLNGHVIELSGSF